MSGQARPKVVCNTGPLIGLAQVGLEMLPFQLYPEVVLPSTVRDELLAKPTRDQGKLIAALKHATIYQCKNPPDALLVAELDDGEAEVINAAHELGLTNVLIDERKARRIASRIYQLHVKGTAGLLVDAKKEGIIPRVAPYLDGMIQAGYFLGPSLVEACLKAANE
jgi:predicted nucleic acid-binding protein